MSTQEIVRWQARIEEIKKRLVALGEMRPGSLSKQYNVCGNPTCRCKDPKNPQRHGPYYQLSYSHKGKSTTEFVKRGTVTETRKQLKNSSRHLGLERQSFLVRGLAHFGLPTKKCMHSGHSTVICSHHPVIAIPGILSDRARSRMKIFSSGSIVLFKRNSGKHDFKALATTISDGTRSFLMVRSQLRNDAQTTPRKLIARCWRRPCAMQPSWT